MPAFDLSQKVLCEHAVTSGEIVAFLKDRLRRSCTYSILYETSSTLAIKGTVNEAVLTKVTAFTADFTVTAQDTKAYILANGTTTVTGTFWFVLVLGIFLGFFWPVALVLYFVQKDKPKEVLDSVLRSVETGLGAMLVADNRAPKTMTTGASSTPQVLTIMPDPIVYAKQNTASDENKWLLRIESEMHGPLSWTDVMLATRNQDASKIWIKKADEPTWKRFDTITPPVPESARIDQGVAAPEQPKHDPAASPAPLLPADPVTEKPEQEQALTGYHPESMRFCEIAIRLGILTSEQSVAALKEQDIDRAIGVQRPIGSYLLEGGMLSREQIGLVLEAQKKGTALA